MRRRPSPRDVHAQLDAHERRNKSDAAMIKALRGTLEAAGHKRELPQQGNANIKTQRR